MNIYRLTTVAMLIAAIVIVLPASGADWAAVKPLKQAHAHNDYLNERPLHDALELGFCGIEVDIYLIQGILRVGHDFAEAAKGHSLQQLYLEPLARHIRDNGGHVYPDDSQQTLTLLIDIKTEGEKVYAVLRKTLVNYRDILTTVEDGQITRRAIQVIISGDRPIATISAERTRYAGIDGRLTDLESDAAPHLMPMISDNWRRLTSNQRRNVRSIVQQVHNSGRRVRFWATPDTPAMWKELLEANVDHINTDKLVDLSNFLLKK
ncbi:MAG: phosphatidylinositol-specific phospholipase C/glycerophosphodiester phosphodiesterase family protein [Halieaceae bacterium]|nr:phosphatidylinositol-specific phospholipase C/glycerophosphodiester phosphodiesterase family protein [Halieaceae bacterium]